MGADPARREPAASARASQAHRGSAKRAITGAVSVAIALLAAPGAHAATIAPSTLADDNTANGNCTLREAVRAANANTAVDACAAGDGTDTITLAGGRYALSVGPTGDQVAASG